MLTLALPTSILAVLAMSSTVLPSGATKCSLYRAKVLSAGVVDESLSNFTTVPVGASALRTGLANATTSNGIREKTTNRMIGSGMRESDSRPHQYTMRSFGAVQNQTRRNGVKHVHSLIH